jgi:SNF2 family DNA or RNA helicase
MFESLYRYIGVISVKDVPEGVQISGLPIKTFYPDIVKAWGGTSVPVKYMLTSKGSSSFTIPNFYLPDFIHTLDILINWDYRKRLYTKHNAFVKLKDELIKKTWLNKTQVPSPSILNFQKLSNLRWSPLSHQNDYLKEFDNVVPAYNLKGLLLSAEPGSGKTFTFMMLAEALERKVKICIVPQNSVKKVWEDTVLKVYKNPQKYWHSLSGDPLILGKDYYILHYEYLPKFLEFVKTNLQFFRNRPIISVDECHNFNEIKSLRTQHLVTLHKLLWNDMYTCFMSGSPIKAMGREIIPFLKCSDPYFDTVSEDKFVKIFGLSSVRALEILSARIARITFKVDESVVTGDKPPILKELHVKLPVSDKYLLSTIRQDVGVYVEERSAYYREYMDDMISRYGEILDLFEATLTTDREKEDYQKYRAYANLIRYHYDMILHKAEAAYCSQYEERIIIPTLNSNDKKEFRKIKGVYKYVNLVIIGEALGNIVGKRRQECFTEIANHADIVPIISEAAKKTVCFTEYIETLKILNQRLLKEGYKTEMVYGDTNKDVDKIVDRFTQDPTMNPLCATFKSLSTAVPILAANTVIFMNSPFRHHIRKQAIARVARLGQTEQTYVYDVILDTGGEPNISTRSMDIAEWSKDMVDVMFGGAKLDTHEEELVLGMVTGNLKYKTALSKLTSRVISFFK